MKAKWGAFVVDGRGKIGGHVASKNRAGSYFRTKVTPVNPSSSFQVNVRARQGAIAQAWRGLTQAQRTAWNGVVGDFSKTDIFGDMRNPSGFNLFMRLNSHRLNLAQTILTTPPQPTSVNVFATASLAAAAGAGTLVATVTPATLDAGERVIVKATAPQSPGKGFVKSEFRQIAVLASISGGSIDLATAYTNKFGSVGVAGNKIFCEFVHVNTASGITSQAQQVSAIVAA